MTLIDRATTIAQIQWRGQSTRSRRDAQWITGVERARTEADIHVFCFAPTGRWCLGTKRDGATGRSGGNIRTGYGSRRRYRSIRRGGVAVAVGVSVATGAAAVREASEM